MALIMDDLVRKPRLYVFVDIIFFVLFLLFCATATNQF